MKHTKANYETMNSRARRVRRETSNKTAQLNRIYMRDRGICQICRLPCNREDASRDHVKDFASGCTKEELRSDRNVILAHTWCNHGRHHNTIRPEDFRLKFKIAELYPQLRELVKE